MERYNHKQIGHLIILIMLAVMIFIGVIFSVVGINWIVTVVALVYIVVISSLFYSLTVVIEEDRIEVRCGIGLIRKRFKLNEIESCQIVKDPWYYGWGIRLTPHGWLYRVSGFNAVEIKFRNGKRFRIGTDVPQKLEEAIRQTIIH